MSYIAQGITAAEMLERSRTAATGTSATTGKTPTCPAGTVWMPATATRAGYCARKTSTTGGRTVTGVRETPADAIRVKCGKYGFQTDQAKACEAWLRSGKPEADLPSVLACAAKGYTGQSLDICVDGRKKGAGFGEIDKVIAELAAQAEGAQAAQLAAEQEAVVARKRRTWLILGGLAAAGVVGYFVWKKYGRGGSPKP